MYVCIYVCMLYACKYYMVCMCVCMYSFFMYVCVSVYFPMYVYVCFVFALVWKNGIVRAPEVKPLIN